MGSQYAHQRKATRFCQSIESGEPSVTSNVVPLGSRSQTSRPRGAKPEIGGSRQRQVELLRAVLTLFVEGHSSYRGINKCIKELLGEHICPTEIGLIVNEAGKRAKELLKHQKPVHLCSIALDEQYGNKRGEAYLNIIDAQSTVVWATYPPVSVDTDWLALSALVCGSRRASRGKRQPAMEEPLLLMRGS